MWDIERSGAMISGEKSEFCKDRLKAAGFICNDRGRHPAPGKVIKVSQCKDCGSAEEIRGFLGLCVYYRVWIKNFFIIAKPIYHLLKRNVEFNWDEDCSNAMELLKKALTKVPALSTLDYSEEGGEIVLAVDASGEGRGAIL